MERQIGREGTITVYHADSPSRRIAFHAVDIDIPGIDEIALEVLRMATLGNGQGADYPYPIEGEPPIQETVVRAWLGGEGLQIRTAEGTLVPLPEYDALLDAMLMEMAQESEPRGYYLCEVCFDTMTNYVVPAHLSPTGEEMAICTACKDAHYA